MQTWKKGNRSPARWASVLLLLLLVPLPCCCSSLRLQLQCVQRRPCLKARDCKQGKRAPQQQQQQQLRTSCWRSRPALSGAACLKIACLAWPGLAWLGLRTLLAFSHHGRAELQAGPGWLCFTWPGSGPGALPPTAGPGFFPAAAVPLQGRLLPMGPPPPAACKSGLVMIDGRQRRSGPDEDDNHKNPKALSPCSTDGSESGAFAVAPFRHLHLLFRRLNPIRLSSAFRLLCKESFGVWKEI